MSNSVANSTKASGLKGFKVRYSTWASLAHEAVNRGVSMIVLFTAAWDYFLALPESRREKLVRDAENMARAARTDAA